MVDESPRRWLVIKFGGTAGKCAIGTTRRVW